MRSHSTSKNKQILIIRIIKTPIQALCKAKDIYIKGITNFSTTYTRPMMIKEDANRIAVQLPRSVSTTALSNNHGRNQPNQNYRLRSSSSRKGVSRSFSVGMGRIDEDRVSSFRNDNIVLLMGSASRVPRSTLGSAHQRIVI